MTILLTDDTSLPTERDDITAWLDARAEELAVKARSRLRAIIERTALAVLDSITASVDLTPFDDIPDAWMAVVRDELVPALGESYMAGGVTAWLGARPMTEAFAAQWAKVTNDNAVSYMADATNRLKGVGDTTWRMVRSQVTTALENGDSTEKLKDRIQNLGTWSESRADTIARTETNAAYVQGDIAGARALGDKGPVEKVWVAVMDARTRDSHAEAHNQVRLVDEMFDVGGTAMDAPHDPSAPAAEVVNCFLGDALVEWVGELVTVFRRWYSGDIVELTTGDGVRLAMTPNHPVLAASGWVAAQALHVGDEIVNVLDPDRLPQVDDVPPCIEQIYSAAREVGTADRIGGRRVDFHGDGSDQDIDVVRANSDLLAVLDAEGVESSRHLLLVGLDGAERSFSGLGDGSILATSLRSGTERVVASRRVSGRSKVAAFGGGEVLHAVPVGFASGAWSDVDGAQPTNDHVTADTVAASECEDRVSLVVGASQVVRIEKRQWSGHVFNLATSSGLLLYNGIATSNCRCWVEMLNVGDTRPDGSEVEDVASTPSHVALDDPLPLPGTTVHAALARARIG